MCDLGTKNLKDIALEYYHCCVRQMLTLLFF